AATPRLHDGGRLGVRAESSLVPVSAKLGLRATAEGSSVRLTWSPRPTVAGKVFYRVLRVKGPVAVSCAGTPAKAANDCRLYMDQKEVTRATSTIDRPGKGTWSYRIGVAANWLNDPSLGDIYVVSPPVTVTVR
ncbi:MAG TPA: hypothetical protein VF025_14715, partial [Gaiellaceae bacterium]